MGQQHGGLIVGALGVCRRLQSVSRRCTSPRQTKLRAPPSSMPCCMPWTQLMPSAMAARNTMLTHQVSAQKHCARTLQSCYWKWHVDLLPGSTNAKCQHVRVAATGAVHPEGSDATGAGQPQLPNAATTPAVASCSPAAAAADLPADDAVPTLLLPKSASAVPAPPDVEV